MASLTQSQRNFTEKAYAAAAEAGLTGAQADLAVAQAAHETAWGTKPSGVNNYHGIKGPGTTVATHEVVDGRRVGIKDSFRNFGSMADSFKAWAGLMGRKFGDVLSASTLGQAVKGLRAGFPGGYATDPNYDSKVTSIARSISDYNPTNVASLSPDRIATPATNPRTVAPVAPVERGLLGPVQQTAFSTGGLLSPPNLSPVSSAQAAPAQAAPAQLARNMPDVTRFGPVDQTQTAASQAIAAAYSKPSPTMNRVTASPAPETQIAAAPSMASYSPISAPFSPTPASYQTPAFSTAAPKIDAFGQPPAPGLQPAVPSQYTKAPAPTIATPEAPTSYGAPVNPSLNQFPDKPKPGLLSGLLNPTTLAGAAIGNMALGPVGGLLGGLLGHTVNNTGGLGGLLGGTYNGPTNNIGSGLGAISQVLGGAPVGTQAFSRSMPGMSVTSIPGGAIQRTNQYGVTQITTADGRTGRGVKGRTGGAGGNYGGIKSEGARNAIDHGIGGLF